MCRSVLVRSIFDLLSSPRCVEGGVVGCQQMRRFAAACGFHGTEAEWLAEYDAICEAPWLHTFVLTDSRLMSGNLDSTRPDFVVSAEFGPFGRGQTRPGYCQFVADVARCGTDSTNIPSPTVGPNLPGFARLWPILCPSRSACDQTCTMSAELMLNTARIQPMSGKFV